MEVTGRLKDIVIRKGEKISATALEDLFSTHPSIAEVAIIGLPTTSAANSVARCWC